MAHITSALGSSHGPTMRTPAEKILELGAKDMVDPRLDYHALLQWAKPGIRAELEKEVLNERYARCQMGIAKVRQLLSESAPDVLLVFSNLHGQAPDHHQQMFAVFTGDAIPGPRLRARDGRAYGIDPVPRATEYPCDPRLSSYLVDSLLDAGFDIHCCSDARAAGIGHEFTEVYDLYARGADIPMVPFMISRTLPNQASARRCYQLGQAVRRALDAWNANTRVVLIASGGLSHQVLDEELDRMVVEALVTGDVETLLGLSRGRLNFAPGTPEILNWVTVAGAMGGVPMTLIDYIPCYRSMASTGHGVAFGHWSNG